MMPPGTDSPTDPRAAYADRLAARRAAVARLDARIDRVGRTRLLLFLGIIALAVLGEVTAAFSPWWAALGALPFFALVLYSKSLAYRRAGAVRAVRYYERGLDRLDGKWAGRGPTGERFADPNHLYAADLDLFGGGSLFQRLCAARTASGQRLLADWLLAPAPAAEVRDRQQAVADLRDRLDLREYFAAIGNLQATADAGTLVEWGGQPPRDVPRWRRVAVFALGWFNVAAVVGWLAAGTTSIPVLVGGLLSALVVWPLARWSRDVIRPAEASLNDLPLLEAILARLERESFRAPRLLALQAALGGTPSAQVRELRRLLDWSAARRNPLFFPVALAMLWDVRMALRLEAWRTASGPSLGRWLAAVAELEALGSLAGYAFENPADPLPDVADGPPRFDGTGIGHPLLPADRCVRNDVQLGGGVRVLMISGSNMSGKSTLLRAVGTNVVLALAGAPVRAARLTLTPLMLGATMRVHDSLQEGRSRFFAEVSRVRAVLDRAALRPPVLFLFDELFAGTNSADRLLGAEAVLRKLLDAGAVGLVTTHDLALTAIVGRLGGGVANVHFADQVTQGEMSFDYAMRPGVVPHGNGVALMRAVGLEV